MTPSSQGGGNNRRRVLHVLEIKVMWAFKHRCLRRLRREKQVKNELKRSWNEENYWEFSVK